ncbi:unnamed protein product, partial [Rotaria sp. Silwood1]
MADIAL